MSVTQIRGTTQIISGSITNAEINASAGILLSKLEALTDGSIIIGNVSAVATEQATSGDITLSNAGVFAIGSEVIVNGDVNASAAIDFSKLAALTDGNILVGSGTNVVTSVNPTGDIDVSNTGVFSIASGVIVDDDISGAAAIALSKLAEDVIQADGGQAFTAAQPMGNNKLTGLANGTVGTDAVNLNQLNAQTNDLDRKNGVDLVEIVNLTLSGEQTIDGVLTSASRVLLIGQTALEENGIYTTAAGAWARTSDADAASEVTLGLMTTVELGSARAGTVWLLTTVSATPTVIDTTELTFTELPNEVVTASGFLAKASGDITLANLANGTMIVGNGSGVATAVTMSGDVTITNAGVAAIASGVIVNDDINGSAAIAYGKLNLSTSIVNGDISASAAIAFDKLAPLTNGNILVGDGSNDAVSVAMSGDATIVASGALTLASNVLKEADVVTRAVPTGLINGSNTSYALANTPVTGTEMVYLNGILQNVGAGNDYTISGLTITYLAAPATGDVLLVSYLK